MTLEVPLLGGTANQGRVHRVGDTVRRPMRPTSAATHALLRHLESVGFDGAPRVLGVDGAGREVLSYVPGQAVTAPAAAWGLTDSALRSVGRLLRRFHDAAAGFDPSPYRWSHAAPGHYGAPEPHGGSGIAHNDLNLDNVVFRGGTAVALIDFDLAGPASAVWDVAAAARLWAPLRAPSDVTDVRRGRELHRMRLLVDAYGLDDAGRAAFLPALRESHRWMYGIVRDGAARRVPGFVAYWTPEAAARAERARVWFDSAAAEITAALR